MVCETPTSLTRARIVDSVDPPETHLTHHEPGWRDRTLEGGRETHRTRPGEWRDSESKEWAFYPCLVGTENPTTVLNPFSKVPGRVKPSEYILSHLPGTDNEVPTESHRDGPRRLWGVSGPKVTHP